jgi:hypothetical protein
MTRIAHKTRTKQGPLKKRARRDLVDEFTVSARSLFANMQGERETIRLLTATLTIGVGVEFMRAIGASEEDVVTCVRSFFKGRTFAHHFKQPAARRKGAR